ncbi:MAG: polyketide cyclase [Nitrosopumilus sp.]|nr:polyketide cyclase [Nitrosopumilus sp.]
MPKFSLEKTVNAKIDNVFEIFANFENYQNLVPQYYPSVRVRSVRGNISVVEEHFLLGNIELLIMAKHVSKKPILHEVFVIGGDVKGSTFRQKFIELENATKILIDVDLKFKGKLKIKNLFGNNSFSHYYDRIIDAFVKIAEN